MAPRGAVHGLWALIVSTAFVASGAVLLDVVVDAATAELDAWDAPRNARAAARDVTSRTARFPEPGSFARDFALPVLAADEPWTGRDTLRLSDFRGRWVYLDVFGTWCLPCTQKYPKMTEISRALADDGVAVVGLLLEERPHAAAGWFAANGGMAYPFLLLDDETTREWGLTGAPMGFVISPEGRIERKCYGCSTGADALEALPRTIRELSRP